jgi:hypothetical protein
MADISGNPWNFTTADVATTAAITSIVRNGKGSATITTTAPHGLTGQPKISVQGASPNGWNRGYRVNAVPSTTTLLVKLYDTQELLANAGAAGNIYTLAYPDLIEVTQMLWDTPTAADKMTLTDACGRLVWGPTAPNAGGPLTYMKCFWIAGLVIVALPSGTLQISV